MRVMDGVGTQRHPPPARLVHVPLALVADALRRRSKGRSKAVLDVKAACNDEWVRCRGRPLRDVQSDGLRCR